MRVALVGIGRWGRKLLRVLRELDGVTPVPVTRDGRPLPDLTGDPRSRPTPTLSEVLGDADVPAIVVATPTATHRDVVGRCLAAGKHVLAEKPLCTSARQARELERMAETSGLVLRTGHTFLYHPAFAVLATRLATEPLLSVHASWRRPVPAERDLAWELLPHPVSIIHRLAGGPPDVVRRLPWADGPRAELRWPTGLAATVEASRRDPPRWAVEISTRSRIRFEWTADALRERADGIWRTVPHPADEALRRELSEFLRAVRTGDRGDLVPGAEVVAVVEAVLAGGGDRPGSAPGQT
jgi:predicted dehydrogenase